MVEFFTSQAGVSTHRLILVLIHLMVEFYCILIPHLSFCLVFFHLWLRIALVAVLVFPLLFRNYELCGLNMMFSSDLD